MLVNIRDAAYHPHEGTLFRSLSLFPLSFPWTEQQLPDENGLRNGDEEDSNIDTMMPVAGPSRPTAQATS